MFNAIRTNKLQIISTIILAVALAFLVILFVKKANAEGFLENQLKIRIVGKQDYFIQQEDGKLQRYTDVKPGEVVQFYISYIEKMGNDNWVQISNPKEVVWMVDGRRVNLQTYKNRATYQVPFYKSWDTITVSATDNTILSGTQKGTLTLVNLEFEEPLANDSDYYDDYYDYGYYDDIPDYMDTDDIMARYMRPVYINGRLFYQIVGLPMDYEPFTCGQFINTINGLRYIPCREYMWEWVIAYRGCLRFHHLYGWVWYYDRYMGGSDVYITINIYYTDDWFIYYPYNSYYDYIYDMGYHDGFRDGYEAKEHEDRKGTVVVKRKGFLKRKVRELVTRVRDKRKIKDSIVNALHLKNKGRKTIEDIFGREGKAVEGPEDERIFRGDFRGEAKDVFHRVNDLRIARKDGSKSERSDSDSKGRIIIPGGSGDVSKDSGASGEVKKRIPTIPTVPAKPSDPFKRRDDENGSSSAGSKAGDTGRGNDNKDERKIPIKPTVPKKEERPKADPAKPQNGNVFDRKTPVERGNQSGKVKPVERKTPVERGNQSGQVNKPVERKTSPVGGTGSTVSKPIERKTPPASRIGSGSKPVERKAPPSGGSSQNSDRKGGSEKKRR